MPSMRPLWAAVAVLVLTTLPVAAQKRVALVIGNSAYTYSAPLTNPANDAADMAEALKTAGFAAIVGLDVDKRGFDMKVREFARALSPTPQGRARKSGRCRTLSGGGWIVTRLRPLSFER